MVENFCIQRVRGWASACCLVLLLTQAGGCVTHALLAAESGGGRVEVEPPVRLFLSENGEMRALARTEGAGDERAWEIARVVDIRSQPEDAVTAGFPAGARSVRPLPPTEAAEPPPSSNESPQAVISFSRDPGRERFDTRRTPEEAALHLERRHGPGVWLPPVVQLDKSTDNPNPAFRVLDLGVDGEPVSAVILAYTTFRLPPKPIPWPLRAIGLPFAVAADAVLLPAYAVGGVVALGTVAWVYRDGG